MSENPYLLSGIKVVEVASMVMAPSVGAVLAEFGADVIKIEPPGKGDNNRYMHQLPGMPISDIAYCYEMDNRNKRGMVLDLKQQQGLEILHRLLEGADIFITNFRQPALKKLGLWYEQLKEDYPRLIYAYGTGFGEHGPDANLVAYDMVSFWARSGIEASMYPEDAWLGPIPAGTGDHVTGLSMVSAIAMALYGREKSGKGTKVSTSLIASGIWTNATIVQAKLCDAEFQPRRPRENGYNALSMPYRCQDGELIKLTVVDTEKNWPGVCRAIEQPNLATDPRFADASVRTQNMPALIAILEEYFAGTSIVNASARLRVEHIPHSPINNVFEAVEDPQLVDNDILTSVCDRDYLTVRSPFSLADFAKAPATPAPKPGEHSRAILKALGLESAAIDRLFAEGVVA